MHFLYNLTGHVGLAGFDLVAKLLARTDLFMCVLFGA